MASGSKSASFLVQAAEAKALPPWSADLSVDAVTAHSKSAGAALRRMQLVLDRRALQSDPADSGAAS